MAKLEEKKTEKTEEKPKTSADLVTPEIELQEKIKALEGKLATREDDDFKKDILSQLDTIKKGNDINKPNLPDGDSSFWKKWLDELDALFED